MTITRLVGCTAQAHPLGHDPASTSGAAYTVSERSPGSLQRLGSGLGSTCLRLRGLVRGVPGSLQKLLAVCWGLPAYTNGFKSFWQRAGIYLPRRSSQIASNFLAAGWGLPAYMALHEVFPDRFKVSGSKLGSTCLQGLLRGFPGSQRRFLRQYKASGSRSVRGASQVHGHYTCTACDLNVRGSH